MSTHSRSLIVGMATFSCGFSNLGLLERAVEKYRPLSLLTISQSYPVLNA